mgnify:CR=1 FL=1
MSEFKPILKKAPWSHTDHSLPPQAWAYMLDIVGQAPTGDVVTNVEFPAEWPDSVSYCIPGVPEDEVFYARRNGRSGPSRMCDRAPVPCRRMTVIAADVDGSGTRTLITAYVGQEVAPPEPWNAAEQPRFTDKEVRESVLFWRSHALAVDPATETRYYKK